MGKVGTKKARRARLKKRAKQDKKKAESRQRLRRKGKFAPKPPKRAPL